MQGAGKAEMGNESVWRRGVSVPKKPFPHIPQGPQRSRPPPDLQCPFCAAGLGWLEPAASLGFVAGGYGGCLALLAVEARGGSVW
eukprot:COSAG02_NODE_23_length_52893_cov_58.101868_25_plen_85_part_00